MVRMSEWGLTYCVPECGTVRYPSSTKQAYGGWAYVQSWDVDYAADLRAKGHAVQVRFDGAWTPFVGYAPTSAEEAFGDAEPPPFVEVDEVPDPNY